MMNCDKALADQNRHGRKILRFRLKVGNCEQILKYKQRGDNSDFQEKWIEYKVEKNRYRKLSGNELNKREKLQ